MCGGCEASPGVFDGSYRCAQQKPRTQLRPSVIQIINDFDIIKDLTLLCDPILLLNAKIEDHHTAFQKVVAVINKLE